MKTHTFMRIMAAVLSCLMLLPLIGIPAFASDPTVYWSNDFDGTGDLSTWFVKKPSTAKIYDNNGDQAAGFEIKGVGGSSRTAAYYAYYNRSSYAVSDLVENGDGTISGSFAVNGTTYTFTNQTYDSNTYITTKPSSTTYRLYTPGMVDAIDGAVNVAAPLRANNSAIAYNASAPLVAFEMKLFFPVGSAARDMAGRIATTSGKNAELYGIKVTSSTVTVKLHENATMLSGAEKTVPTGEWFTLTAVVDTENVTYSIYVNGTWVYTAQNSSNAPTAGFGFNANTWDLLQTNRNNYSPSQLAGYVMIDDVKIYNGAAFAKESKEVSDDMEGYTPGTVLTTASSAYNASAASNFAVYNQIMAESDGNQFIRVPFLYESSVASDPTNYDKTLRPGSSAFTVEDEYFVYEASIRPSDSVTSVTPRIEAQISNLSFDLTVAAGATEGGTAVTADKSVTNGQYLQLFQINLGTGAVLSQYSGYATTGAAGLVQDRWNTVRALFNMSNGDLSIFVNGLLYGTVRVAPQYYSGGWKSCTNASNFAFPTNSLIAVKVNKGDVKVNGTTTQGPAFLSADTAESDYSNVNYVDADNFKSYAMTAENVAILLGNKEKTDDFEGYTAGITLGTANNYNAAYSGEVAPFNQVLADGDNQFVRLPIVASSAAGTTNMDKTLMPGSSAYTVDDEFFVLDASYRPHGNVTTAAETIELQIRKFEFDLSEEEGSTDNGVAVSGTAHVSNGQYLQLFTMNLNTGELNNSYGMTKTGADGLVQDEWNQIHFVLNLKDTSANLFVNGQLYGVIERMAPQYASGGWITCTNPINLSIPANNLIIAKANKVSAAFTDVSAAAADYSDVNYIDIDNIRTYPVAADELVSIPSVNSDGQMLMYVQLGTQRVGNEILYVTKDTEYSLHYFDPSLYDGVVSTVNLSSMRLTSPGGLRFLHKLDMTSFEALNSLVGNGLAAVNFGTLIAPNYYLDDGTLLSKDSLTEAGKKFLDVKAYYGYYYTGHTDENDPDATYFAGSIVNIKDANITLDFAAVGYVEVVLMSGLTYTYYSNGMKVDNVHSTANRVLATDPEMTGWSNASKKIIEAYASGKSLQETMMADLQGLNVLAIGDSLFSGNDKGWDVGCVRENQWVNLLGKTYNWNLTNLGIGGATISYTDANYTTTQKKCSMYDWLFNGHNDYHWNTAADRVYVSGEADTQLYDADESCKYNKYFQIGNFEGKTNADVDLIIMEGGCNDYGTEIAAPLGTVGSTDSGTFIGAYKAIADKLMELYPNAKIVFITTWQLNPQTRPNDTLTSVEYSESVIDLYNQCYADNDRVFLINAGNPVVSGIDMLDNDFVAEYSNDRYHLKDNGMAIMANHMIPRIWEFMVNSES